MLASTAAVLTSKNARHAQCLGCIDATQGKKTSSCSASWRTRSCSLDVALSIGRHAIWHAPVVSQLPDTHGADDCLRPGIVCVPLTDISVLCLLLSAADLGQLLDCRLLVLCTGLSQCVYPRTRWPIFTCGMCGIAKTLITVLHIYVHSIWQMHGNILSLLTW